MVHSGTLPYRCLLGQSLVPTQSDLRAGLHGISPKTRISRHEARPGWAVGRDRVGFRQSCVWVSHYRQSGAAALHRPGLGWPGIGLHNGLCLQLSRVYTTHVVLWEHHTAEDI
ncbi:hypothetical protein J6590_026923 [Homalodisca vitripennis]|nr:hypothetical protein J6590_026923 [Homalodisca vitripennis]